MRVCLFEDHGYTNLEPLSLLRPVFDLLCGQTSLASKQCRFFAPCEIGALVRPQLADLYRLYHPTTPVNDKTWLGSEVTVLVNGRWLPPAETAIDVGVPGVALVGDQVAYAVVGLDRLAHCSSQTIDDCLELWKNSLPSRPAGGRLISYLWELVEQNPEQIELDCRALAGPVPAPSSVALVGPPDALYLDPTAQVDPHVVADTTQGPIVIDAEAVVTAFSRLEGPCYIGPRTHVLGAKIRAGTTLGPCCRVGGEVEASIIQGHSNKYHDGFLGHSYVGEWVNLGAGVQTSDLRNDYGTVRVTVNGQQVNTGQKKVGSFIGDHTKVGLGALLNTGTNAGIFCNLLPSGTLLPKHIPSFTSWWNGSIVDRADLAQQMVVAEEAMRRRGWAFTEAHAALVRQLYEETTTERRRLVLQADQRRWRRSA